MTVHICRKSVSRFVGYYLNIALSAVEIRKDKGAFKVGKLGAVAPRSLSLSAENVHKFIFHHKVKKLGCEGRKGVIKVSARFKDILGSALGNSISVTVGNGCVGVSEGICRTDALCLLSV